MVSGTCSSVTARPFQAATSHIGRRVVQSVVVMQAANERDFVHQFGHARQMFAHMEAGDGCGDRAKLATNLRRRVGLRVKRVDMAWPAVVKDDDARLDLRFAAAGHGSLAACLLRVEFRRRGLGSKQSAQAEAKRAQGADFENRSATQSLTILFRVLRHGTASGLQDFNGTQRPHASGLDASLFRQIPIRYKKVVTI